MGDGPNTIEAKNRIRRERRADSKKFDKILDRAMIDDAKLKAQSTKPKS